MLKDELRFNLIKFPLIQYWIKSSAIVNQVPVLIVNIKFQSKCTTTHHCRTALRIRMANFTCSVAFRMTFITTTTSSKCAGPSQANWSKHSNSRLRVHEQTSRFYQLNWGRNLFSPSRQQILRAFRVTSDNIINYLNIVVLRLLAVLLDVRVVIIYRCWMFIICF